MPAAEIEGRPGEYRWTQTEVLSEMARRAERAHANARLCVADQFKGPGRTNVARRDAHLSDLSLLTGKDRQDLVTALAEGRLLETFGGTSTLEVRECSLCGRTGPVLKAKHTPQEDVVRVVCRAETDCLPTVRPLSR